MKNRSTASGGVLITFTAQSDHWIRSSIHLFLVMLLLGASLFAQVSSNALSKEKLVALKNAGIGDSVLIEQIQKDGISFDMNADATLELKKAGFSNEVLQTLLKVTSKPSVVSTSAESDPIRTLYEQQKYAELADYLKSRLDRNPADGKSRVILIMALLKLKNNEAALAELATLKANSQDPLAPKYALQVQSVLVAMKQQDEVKGRLASALSQYKSQDAAALIDSLSASPFQKTVLKAQLNIYQGKFEEARQFITTAPVLSFSEREKLKAQIAQSQTGYTNLMTKVDGVLYPSDGWVTDRGGIRGNSMEAARKVLDDYFLTVSSLSKIAPLDDRVLDLVFHAGFILLKYEQFEPLADRILASKGSVTIPFYGRAGYFYVVLDSDAHRIYTKPDTVHVFKIQIDNNGAFFSNNKFNNNEARSLSSLVPFDWKFEQVTSISQEVRLGGYGDIKRFSYVLRLGPSGLAPNYALMADTESFYGGPVQMAATYNLGRYVAHVINNKNVSVALVDPSKTSGGGGSMGLLMAGIYGISAASGNQALATQNLQVMTQAMAEGQAQKAAIDSTKGSTWYEEMVNETFGVAQLQQFSDLEKLVNLL
jgi:hypothetical protein